MRSPASTRMPSASVWSSPENFGVPFSAPAPFASVTSSRRSAYLRCGSPRAAECTRSSMSGVTVSTRSTEIRVISEGLHQHGLAGGDVTALFFEDDQAVAGGHRGKDARALGPGGPRLPAAVAPLDDAALELAPALALAHRLERGRLGGVGEQAAPPGQLEDRRAQKEHGRQHRGDPLARQPPQEGPGDSAQA